MILRACALIPVFIDLGTSAQSLPFAKVEHNISTIDAQPSSTAIASLIVTVMGLLKVRAITRFPVQPAGGTRF